MAQTICNGDATTIVIPQAFSDLSGAASASQLPGGAPTGSGSVVMASGATITNCTLVNPALGTPASGILSGCTFPTLNQNTTGTSGGLTGTPSITVGSVISTTITASGLITGSANIQLGVAGALSGVITLQGSTSGGATITAPAVAGTVTNNLVFSNGITTNAGLTSGVAGTRSGVLTLAGSTSGSCAITAPAVSGTIANAITFSNSISIATGTTYQINGTQISATALSNGTTGTAGTAVVLATSPSIATPTLTGTTTSAGINATGTVAVTGAITASLTLGVTGISTLTGGLATLTKYNGITLTGNGIPSEVGVATATTASAAVAATTILAAPVAATLYRVSAYLKITVATSTPVAGPVTLTYADKDGVAQSVIMSLRNAAGAVATSTGNTTTTPVSGDAYVYCNSGTAIQYAIAFSGTGTYEYVLKVEQL